MYYLAGKWLSFGQLSPHIEILQTKPQKKTIDQLTDYYTIVKKSQLFNKMVIDKKRQI